MSLLRLAMQSLLSRRLSTSLTVLSVALSVGLLLSIEKARRAAEDGFTGAVSQVDLIVGARSGPIQLILYTVFNVGTATHNISWDTYERWSDHPAVDWTIPYSLGDSHRGFRVVATTAEFFERYRYRGEGRVEFESGKAFHDLHDVVVGSAVAQELGYQPGDRLVIAHGATKGTSFQEHGDQPFALVGVLKPTATPIDRSVYISMEAMEALHLDWKDGVASTEKTDPKSASLRPETLTAFFLRTKSRIDSLRLQREINTDPDEALLAIVPGATLQELWRSLGHVESVLRLISWLVMAVSLATMLIALTTTLNERRREMAILRSLGAGPSRILALLVSEAFFLTALGVLAGVAVSSAAFAALAPWLEMEYGLALNDVGWGMAEISRVLAVLLAGLVVGLIPAWRARGQVLKDGLSSQ